MHYIIFKVIGLVKSIALNNTMYVRSFSVCSTKKNKHTNKKKD